MTEKHQTLGQFETPLNVADLILGFCLRRPTERVFDPGCGEGHMLGRTWDWLDWLAASPSDILPDALVGAELDSEAASAVRKQIPQARIYNRNFLAMQPGDMQPIDTIGKSSIYKIPLNW